MKTSIFAIAAILTSCAAFGQPSNPTRVQEPNRIVNRADNPQVSRPARGDQKVAVMMIRLDVDKGAVRSARVASSRRMTSFAPKVFVRQSGAWEVIIEGDTRRSFFVDNPALREAEAHPSSNNKYQWVGETGVIDWPLIVPLYADGRALGARAITIRDTSTGATILQTTL